MSGAGTPEYLQRLAAASPPAARRLPCTLAACCPCRHERCRVPPRYPRVLLARHTRSSRRALAPPPPPPIIINCPRRRRARRFARPFPPLLLHTFLVKTPASSPPLPLFPPPAAVADSPGVVATHDRRPMHIQKPSHMRAAFFKYQMRVATCHEIQLPFESEQRADPERRRGTT